MSWEYTMTSPVPHSLPASSVLLTLALSACGPAVPQESDSATSTGGETSSSSAGGTADSPTGAEVPCSEVHEGDLVIFRDSDLATFSNLGRVTGFLKISFHEREVPDLSFLGCLHTAEGGLAIWDNWRLESTEGLKNLQHTRWLSVTGNGDLRVVTGFDQLHELQNLGIHTNPSLEAIHLDSLRAVHDTLRIGLCGGAGPAGGHDVLTDLSGFSGLTKVRFIAIEGNEALASAGLFDALAANGDPAPLESAWIRHNPLLSPAEVNAQLDVLGVPDESRLFCGNLGGEPECEYCPIGE